MMKISLILEAVNRMSAPMRAAMQSVEKMTAPIAAVTRGLEKMGAAANASTRQVRMNMMSMFDTARDAAHRSALPAYFRELAGEEGMARASRSAAYLRNEVSGLTGGLSILKYASVAAGIGLGEEFVRGVFTAGGEAQRMLVTLTRLEGSADRAKKAMSWMQNFALAGGANFSMPDIMRSYQMAKNFGMNPQGGSMATFADLAAGERVSMKQVLYAVKDAMEGTSTRPISNLGIKMRQGKGQDPIDTYTYANLAGKFVTEKSTKSPDDVLKTLVRIISSKYSGLAIQQSQTVPGGIEQLKKLLYLFEMKVANAGVMDWALKQMNRFFAYVREASASGALDRLAKSISNFLTGTGDKIIAFAQSTNWTAVSRDLTLFAGTAVLLARALGGLATLGGGGLSGFLNLFIASKLFGIASALMGLVAPIITVTAAFLGFDIAAAPIAAIIAGIAAMIAIGWLLYANWGRVWTWFRGIWNMLPGWVQIGIVALTPFLSIPLLIYKNWTPISAFFKRLWNSIPAPPGWLSMIVGGAVSVATGMPVLGAAALGPARATGSTAAHSKPIGKLTIELTGSASDSAKVKKLQAEGYDVEVKRGPVGRPG